MKKLIPLTIVLSSALSISAFAASANEATFPCPTVEQVIFQKTVNGNGSITITATANSTMPPDLNLGTWYGIQNYAGLYDTVGPITLRNNLSNLPLRPSCVFEIGALDYNRQPTTINISVNPNGSALNNYLYSGNSAAITAISKPGSK